MRPPTDGQGVNFDFLVSSWNSEYELFHFYFTHAIYENEVRLLVCSCSCCLDIQKNAVVLSNSSSPFMLLVVHPVALAHSSNHFEAPSFGHSPRSKSLNF